MPPTRSLQDALERDIEVAERPARIVSLVPSVTELVCDLGARDRLVGVSRYCTEPAGALDGVARVGGQKDPDVAAIVALRPEVVLAVMEENVARDVEALAAAGVPVYVADVRCLDDAVALLGEICDVIDGERAVAETLAREARQAIAEAQRIAHEAGRRRRVFCPVWRDPWIAAASDTYLYDVLEACGGQPIVAGPRVGNDRRYPKVDLAETARALLDVALLPDEPYAFGPSDRAEVARLLDLRDEQVHLVSGKRLQWYGRRTRELPELARLLAATPRRSC